MEDGSALASNLIQFSFVTLTTGGMALFSSSPDCAQPLQCGISIWSALPRDIARQASNARTCIPG